MKKLSLLTYLFVCTLTACTPLKQSPQDKYFSDTSQLTRDYENAVIDAVIPDRSKVYSELVQIKGPDNSSGLEWITVDGRNMVLVTSVIKDEFLKYWMNDEPFEVGVDCWVSIPSEWSRFKQEFIPLNDTQKMIRMQQLVGLPKNSHYSVVVEFYADAEKIFRPAKDPETDDRVASIEYPVGTKADYREWFENKKMQSYQGTPAYPFTQLGYCYDWNSNSKNHVGVSEFVVPKGTLIKVKSRMDYQEFIDEIK